MELHGCTRNYENVSQQGVITRNFMRELCDYSRIYRLLTFFDNISNKRPRTDVKTMPQCI